MRFPFPLIIVAIVIVAGTTCWWRVDRAQKRGVLLFGELGRGITIFIPVGATVEERKAAKLLAKTMAAAARSSPERFPVREEVTGWFPRRAIYLGATKRSADLPALTRETPLERPLSFKIAADAIIIRSAERDDAVMASSIFLEQQMGVRWFMPGPNGIEVDHRIILRLANNERREDGLYKSRELGGVAVGEAGDNWARANRLRTVLPHGHTASTLVAPEVLRQRPEFAPLINGSRFFPERNAVVNWQPDLLADGLAAYVADEMSKKFRGAPQLLGVAFGLNDTYRFDQSTRTLSAVQPMRFFRTRPDYSDLLFRFLNEVARPLAHQFPEQFITTYAYDWTENTPRFRVADNVVPFLTADRSMWFDGNFSAGDRALIERWGKAGPKFIGLYDYYYGAPFLVPRPTLWAIKEVLPYAYDKGARAFFAEATPNWALDGPKPWLAAQFLWNPKQDFNKLVDEYYARYWKEVASQMRAFFELCDRRWFEQPKPAVWVKYLKDDDQRRLFPPAVRRQLRAHLDDARAAAKTKVVRERVRFVADAFTVTEAFCAHDEIREELQRLVFDSTTPANVLREAGERYTRAREDFVGKYRELRAKNPLAIQTASIDDYLRSDPRRRVVDEMVRRGATAPVSASWLPKLFEGRTPSKDTLQSPGLELLDDPGMRTLSIKPVHPFTLTDWVERGPWGGKTEPTEHRLIQLVRNPDGSQRIRYSGCNQETLWQWRPAQPGHLYRATVRVKGNIAPGTMVYLLVPFIDSKGRHLGAGHIDRLPAGNWADGVQLEVLVRAPANAAQTAFSLRTLYQVPGDWVEWEALSFRDLGP